VGGLKPDGSRWKLTLKKAISDIEDGNSLFYIERTKGRRVDVIVAVNTDGSKYLKTTADREQPVTLLSLPACPEI